MPRLAAIVGGDGEREAVPILIRRIALDIDPGLVPDVRPVLKVPESLLLKADEFERALEFAARKLAGRGGILVLLDCDDGCPAKDGPALLKRAACVRPEIPVKVVLAKREFEAWFLAAAESVRGQRGLPADLTAPTDPEAIRGAKEWLTNKMPDGRSYSETTDQPALASLFDMDAARRSDSFDKCYREVSQLLTLLRQAFDKK